MYGYLRQRMDRRTRPLHLLDEGIALGNDPFFPCPIRIPEEVQKELTVIYPVYAWVDGVSHVGQLVLHRAISERVRKIFEELLRRRFPIAGIVPIAAFNWDDECSMLANNTSGFNYRYKDKPGKPELSSHALGLAIDINPFLNPCNRNGIITPAGACYDPDMPGTITEDSFVVDLFRAAGADWGGHWSGLFDPQHFEFSLV